MKLQIKIEDERLLKPEYRMKYATPGSAAIDLRACGYVDDGKIKPINHGITVSPEQEILLSAGFKMALPDNLAAVLIPRSGLGAKEGIVLGNSVGLLDEDYRGMVFVSLWNRRPLKSTVRGFSMFTVEPMMRVAQMMIVPIAKPELEYVQELPETVRGEGGFGHSGV